LIYLYLVGETEKRKARMDWLLTGRELPEVHLVRLRS
jgi:hypothetical protein